MLLELIFFLKNEHLPLASTPPPLLSHSVTHSSTPSPLPVDVVYGRPLTTTWSSQMDPKPFPESDDSLMLSSAFN